MPGVVLISGASQGIGRAVAERLARGGWRVFGTSRRPENCPPIPGVSLLPLDLHSAFSIQACVQAVIDQAGCIDVLINNAGLVGTAMASEEADIDAVRAIFETNFFGAVQLINAALPVMRAQRSGLILNISSTTGQVAAPPFFTFYAASKHAIEAYTEGLRHEVRPFGIRVALIEPGYTFTGIGATIQPPERSITAYSAARERVTRLNQAGIRSGSDPEEVAWLVENVLRQQRPALRYLHGANSFAILTAQRILPAPLFERLIQWLFLDWQPRAGSSASGAPAQEDLGIRGWLFHEYQLRRLLKAAAAGVCALILGALLVGRRKK